MTRKRTPQVVSSSLQRAIAEDRERTRTNSQVSYRDLNNGRPPVGRLPYQVITPELREKRGWGPPQPTAGAAPAADAPAPVGDGKPEVDAP
jgi:hypothetical protein